jgi:hypothetical protein
MKNKIRTLEDLQNEKRMLRLEIDATENLLGQALHLSKDHLLDSVADSFFSLMKRDPLDTDDFAQILSISNDNKSHWWQKLVPFIPLVLKLSGFFFDMRKVNKAKKTKSKQGEVVLHRAAS